MSGKRAKAIRKKIYGEDFSPRERRYDDSRGIRLADSFRQRYKMEKRNWTKK